MEWNVMPVGRQDILQLLAIQTPSNIRKSIDGSTRTKGQTMFSMIISCLVRQTAAVSNLKVGGHSNLDPITVTLLLNEKKLDMEMNTQKATF